jgi:hypothetical protein
MLLVYILHKPSPKEGPLLKFSFPLRSPFDYYKVATGGIMAITRSNVKLIDLSAFYASNRKECAFKATYESN